MQDYLGAWQVGLGVGLGASALAYHLLDSRRGVTPPKEFSISLPNTEDAAGGHGAVHRNAQFQQLCDRFPDGEATLYHTFLRGVKLAGDRPCLGHRPISIQNGKPVAGPFVWETYTAVAQRARNFGSGLMHLGLNPEVAGDALTGPIRPLALLLKNRPEWVIAEQACYHFATTTVPLYDTLGPDTIEMVINETETATVVFGADEYKKLVAAKRHCPTFKFAIQIEEPSDEIRAALAAVDVKVYSFAEVEEAGKANPQKEIEPTPDTIATFCYTSGTTGKSKGALLTHRNLVSTAVAVEHIGLAFTVDDVHLSYLPLAHVFERVVEAVCYCNGTRVGFYQGNTALLADDLQALRPTIFPTVPRLLNKMYDKVMASAQAGGVATTLFNAAYNAKLRGLRSGWLTHQMWDKLVFNKIARKMGLDRCRLVLTGSAPIAPHVLDFLRIVLSTRVLEGYGQTEGTAGSSVQHVDDFSTGNVGGPLPCNEIKLVAVEEMGYTIADRSHGPGIPCIGRGEICLRGPNTFKGYFKMERETRDAIDADGWVHTGDIGLWTPRGQLKIIDRKKNIFKLSHGEYIAPEKIENIYGKSAFVAQVFVHGDSFNSVLVAVVVPDPAHVHQWAAANGESANLEDAVKNPKLKAAILADLERVGKEEKLLSFERVKDVHLDATPFSMDNDLLTPSFKLKRTEAKKYYKAQIDEMYSRLEAVAGQRIQQA